jgi:hypothetical protein
MPPWGLLGSVCSPPLHTRSAAASLERGTHALAETRIVPGREPRATGSVSGCARTPRPRSKRRRLEVAGRPRRIVETQPRRPVPVASRPLADGRPSDGTVARSLQGGGPALRPGDGASGHTQFLTSLALGLVGDRTAQLHACARGRDDARMHPAGVGRDPPSQLRGSHTLVEREQPGAHLAGERLGQRARRAARTRRHRCSASRRRGTIGAGVTDSLELAAGCLPACASRTP